MDYEYYDEADYIDEEDIQFEKNFISNDSILQWNGQFSDGHSATITDHIHHNYEFCFVPSVTQALKYLSPLLLGSLLCRLLCMAYARRARLDINCSSRSNYSWQEGNRLNVAPLHIINAVCGIGILYVNIGNQVLVLLLLNAISYGLLQSVRLSWGRTAAIAIAVASIGSQFVYELTIWHEKTVWTHLRGMQLVINMKVISLAFDLTWTGPVGLRMPGLIAYAGYTLSPSTCALGPWISYSRYLEALYHKPALWRSLCQMLLNLLIALLTMAVSNCVAPTLSDLFAPKKRQSGPALWLSMYMSALSVRTSHYFICYLSQTQLALNGQHMEEIGVPGSRTKTLLGDQVVRPLKVEWPRSLSVLPRWWNTPMHGWFKHYIYATPNAEPRSRRRSTLAIFYTYVVSSLMHSMDFRIYVVLLSLAIFAEGEAMLRRHLAALFNACVSANPCRGAEHCRYVHCPQRLGWRCCRGWLVRLANLGFTLLTICHMTYLSVVLINDTLIVETGSEMAVMQQWSAVGFFSHYVGIGMFVIYMFIT